MACLGSPTQTLRGAIFESWVVSELFKTYAHCGVQPNLFHYRETRGLEIDLLIDQGERLDAIEIKSASTVTSDMFKNLRRFADRIESIGDTRRIVSTLVYGGDESQQRTHARLASWRNIPLST